MSRLGYVMVTYLLTLFSVVFSFFHHTPRLLWNGTASVPIGLYALHPPTAVKVGDLVVDEPPDQLATYMATRQYLPLKRPLLKYVGAISGQTVCRDGSVISIDGLAVATALGSDHANRPLPSWQGCYRLKLGQVFLLNPTVAASFDGRYFGVLPLASITARAAPLWTWSGG